MNGAMAFVQRAAERNQGWILAQIVDVKSRADSAGDSGLGQLSDEAIDAGSAIFFLVGEKTGASVFRKITLQLIRSIGGQLVTRDEKAERFAAHDSVGAVQPQGVKQWARRSFGNGGGHGSSF